MKPHKGDTGNMISTLIRAEAIKYNQKPDTKNVSKIAARFSDRWEIDIMIGGA